MRVAGFLGGRGDGVEADISEENHPRSGENAAPPVFPKTSGILRDEGNPIVGVDVGGAAKNEEDDDGEFDDHDGIVEICGFANANHEESGDGQANQTSGQIEQGPTLAPCAVIKDEGGGTKGGGKV